MSLAIKVGIVVLGVVFYFFSISALLNGRRTKAEQQVLFDSIDWNGDGVLSRQQINAFRPCPQSNRSKLINTLNGIGSSVTFDQFETDVNNKMMKYAIAPCAQNAHVFANPAEISKRTAANTVNPFFTLYDLNQDDKIRYNEYQLVNKFHGRSIKGATQTFVFIDGNNDWELTRDEVAKAKIQNLDPKLPSSVRRKPPPPRHGHHAAPAAAAAAAPVAAASNTINRQRIQTPVYDEYYSSGYRQEPQSQDYYEPHTQSTYRDPLDAPVGQYDIIYNPRQSASERIERERRAIRQAAAARQAEAYQRHRVDPYAQTYQPRAAPRRPVRSQAYQEPIPQNERLQATGRLDTLSGPKPRTRTQREPVYRQRRYEQAL